MPPGARAKIDWHQRRNVTPFRHVSSRTLRVTDEVQVGAMTLGGECLGKVRDTDAEPTGRRVLVGTLEGQMHDITPSRGRLSLASEALRPSSWSMETAVLPPFSAQRRDAAIDEFDV